MFGMDSIRHRLRHHNNTGARLRLWYGYSTFIGALNGGIANCLINYRWVFHAFEMKKRNIAIRYLVVWGGSILLNTYGTYILTELSDQYFMFSKSSFPS